MHYPNSNNNNQPISHQPIGKILLKVTMRLATSFLGTLVGVFALITEVTGDFNQAYVCSTCTLVLGIVEEASLQAQLEPYLKGKCDEKFDKKIEKDACEKEVETLVSSVESKASPDDVCKGLDLCYLQECTLYTTWPVTLPAAQPEWPTQRRRLYNRGNGKGQFPYLNEIFHEIAGRIEKPANNNMHTMVSSFAKTATIIRDLNEMKKYGKLTKIKDEHDVSGCGHDIACHADALVKHMPFQDHDGDTFASKNSKTLRGNDWRGIDCDDKSDKVYPGRKINSANDDEIDHDCNGIFGSNETGAYENLFCSQYPGKSLVMLGDSATAHFHLPPQWLTAQNWGIDNFIGVAENEIDFPQCSWGTGHVDPDLCPYQDEVPGISGVTSLYLKLRERNRCNNNDFQNIGVNGARITSAEGLVDAFHRDRENDKPVLLWISLIGNDVCNGHPGFDHMTTPETFYLDALNTLNRLDTMLPPNSHVVALGLFDGELLYDIMHDLQHPVGSTYRELYDFMNCYEESPCWGWLNSNATDRQLTTQRSNELNEMWRDISLTETFENFKFIFYDPIWTELFASYAQSGLPLSNLIEKSDGFHPSQAGNAMFAEAFFSWLQEHHPDALGSENPYNEEIDRIFFANSKEYSRDIRTESLRRKKRKMTQ